MPDLLDPKYCVGTRLSISSKLYDKLFQPVLEVVARLICLKQNAQDVRGRAWADVRKAGKLLATA
jgi:hypothetical protein